MSDSTRLPFSNFVHKCKCMINMESINQSFLYDADGVDEKCKGDIFINLMLAHPSIGLFRNDSFFSTYKFSCIIAFKVVCGLKI